MFPARLPHSLFLQLHLALARPYGAVRLGLAQSHLTAAGIRALWNQTCFDVGVIGRGDHVDVLFGFGFLGFERLPCGVGVVEGREGGGFLVEGIGFLLCVGWG